MKKINRYQKHRLAALIGRQFLLSSMNHSKLILPLLYESYRRIINTENRDATYHHQGRYLRKTKTLYSPKNSFWRSIDTRGEPLKKVPLPMTIATKIIAYNPAMNGSRQKPLCPVSSLPDLQQVSRTQRATTTRIWRLKLPSVIQALGLLALRTMIPIMEYK